jgi:hypothetical protein
MKRAIPYLLATMLLAACATTGSLPSAAERLDSSAHRFYEEVHYGRGAAHTTDDAAMLADATRDFRRAVDRSRSRDELRQSFDRVAERYHHLRRQVENRDPRYAEASGAFERVTDAYLDVDRAMNHPESTAHAR